MRSLSTSAMDTEPMIRCKVRHSNGKRCSLEHGHTGPHHMPSNEVQPCPACGHTFSPMEKLHRRDLEEFIAQAVGEASACWENLQGAGVFDSDRANKVVDRLLGVFEAHQVQLFDEDFDKLKP